MSSSWSFCLTNPTKNKMPGDYLAQLQIRKRLRKTNLKYVCTVQFSCSVVSDSLRPHEPQHARLPCPSPTPGVHPNSSPLSRWCHPTISSSVVPFSSCPQSFPASGSFQMSQLFACVYDSRLKKPSTQRWYELIMCCGSFFLFQTHSCKECVLMPHRTVFYGGCQ